MKNTVKSKQDMDRLFREGSKKPNPYAVVLVAPSPSGIRAGRTAFVAGKKLGSAPARNRAKRKLREASCALGAPWAGYDVVFIAREKTAEAPLCEIVEACGRSVRALGVLTPAEESGKGE